MQLQSLVFMLFMLIIIPVMIISANHNIFFLLCTVIILAASLVKIHSILFNAKQVSVHEDTEAEEDLEEMLNLDVRKFGTGLKVVKSLGLILFYFYCSFYTETIWLKSLIALIIIYWASQLKFSINGNSADLKKENRLFKFGELFINILTVFLLVIIIINKYVKTVI